MKRFSGIFSLLVLLAVTTAGAQQRLVRLTRYDGQRITGVSASSAFEVYLVQSNETKVVAEISEEIEEWLDLNLGADGIVRVGLSGSSRSPRLRNPVAKLTVYLPELAYLKGSGAVEIHPSGQFPGSSTEIVLSGAAELKPLDIRTNALKVNCTGASEAAIRGRSTNLDVRASGASEIDLTFDGETATINCSSASDVEVSGTAERATMTVSGGSNVKASEFSVKRLTVTASAASDAQVWAIDELKANASSASTIRYKGNPQSFSTQSSSAGSVRKMN